MTIRKFDLEAIEKMLPHRKIAMMLSIAIYDSEKPNDIEAATNTENHPQYFEGHYPGSPMFPGHWQGECVCLAGALLAKILYPDTQEGFPLLREVSTKCKSPILPGDDFIVRARIVEKNTVLGQDIFSIAGKILLRGKIVSTTKARGIMIRT